MTTKGQARGPNHFIDPPEIVPGQRTGVRVVKTINTSTERGRYTRIAKALVDNPGEWCKVTIYPFKQGHDMVKVADATLRRLCRTGRPGGMTLIKEYIAKRYGRNVFETYMVEAEMDQQPDGTIEVWARWTERLAA